MQARPRRGAAPGRPLGTRCLTACAPLDIHQAMAVTETSDAGAPAFASALSPEHVLGAIEALAPQARPYNFDDRFDCWGFMCAVYGRLLPGDPLQEDLDAATADPAARSARWAPIVDMAELLPGDVVTTHDRHMPGQFHVVIVYGWVAGRLLVYDSSPRGDIPLLEEQDGVYEYVGARELRTRYMRATGGTDRLRNDGGAYLRLWFVGGRYYNRWLHDRLLEANPGREVGAVALRRRAGLAPLPFYMLRRLPVDRRRRELYDNLLTRRQNAYLPDRAPVVDDEYEAVSAEGRGVGRRPAPPVVVAAPAAAHPGGPATVEWRLEPDAAAAGGGAAAGCRVEVNELRRGVWKHPVLSHDCAASQQSFTINSDVLAGDMAYEVSVFSRGGGGYSSDAVATFVNAPAADNPFLACSMVRPFGLEPDGGTVVDTTTPALTWSIFDAPVSQTAVGLAIHEDGSSDSGAPLVHEAALEGEAAAGTSYVVPAAAGLRAGATYHWYVTPRDCEGRWAYAPVEGVFSVAADADAGVAAVMPSGGAARRRPRAGSPGS
jgi:hypothetical protein